jgi:hypothetical protein
MPASSHGMVARIATGLKLTGALVQDNCTSSPVQVQYVAGTAQENAPLGGKGTHVACAPHPSAIRNTHTEPAPQLPASHPTTALPVHAAIARLALATSDRSAAAIRPPENLFTIRRRGVEVSAAVVHSYHVPGHVEQPWSASAANGAPRERLCGSGWDEADEDVAPQCSYRSLRRW